MKETQNLTQTNQSPQDSTQQSLYARVKEQENKAIEIINLKNIERAENMLNKEYYIFSQEFLNHIEKIYLNSDYICKKLYKSFNRDYRAKLSLNYYSNAANGMTDIISEINNTYTDFKSLPDSIASNFSEIFLNIEEYKNMVEQLLTTNEHFKEDINKAGQAITFSDYCLKSIEKDEKENVFSFPKQENYKIKKIFLNCINSTGVQKTIPLNSEDYHMLNISIHVISGTKTIKFSNMASEVYLLKKLLPETDSKETKKLCDIFFTPSTTQEELIDKANFLLNEIDSELKLLLKVKEFINKFNPLCLTSDTSEASDVSVASDVSIGNEMSASESKDIYSYPYPFSYSYPNTTTPVTVDLANNSDSSTAVTTISTTDEPTRSQRVNVFVSSSNHYTSFYNFYNPYLYNITNDTQQDTQDIQDIQNIQNN